MRTWNSLLCSSGSSASSNSWPVAGSGTHLSNEETEALKPAEPYFKYWLAWQQQDHTLEDFLVKPKAKTWHQMLRVLTGVCVDAAGVLNPRIKRLHPRGANSSLVQQSGPCTNRTGPLLSFNRQNLDPRSLQKHNKMLLPTLLRENDLPFLGQQGPLYPS